WQSGRTGDNPAVGCVILDAGGTIIAEAATGDGGRPHAEELALSRLSEGGAAGGTAYVTLEPCRERSTPVASCSERLLAAGLGRVVIATTDRHPQGDGGLARLKAAGVRIDLGLMQAEADALYADFFAAVSDGD
ncbi:MAG: riboflavin biosynthesis protein RibD, partial [Pseudomonadota bacterium]